MRSNKGHSYKKVVLHIVALYDSQEWKSGKFNSRNLEAFLRQHPKNEVYVISHDTLRKVTRLIQGTKVHFLNLKDLMEAIG